MTTGQSPRTPDPAVHAANRRYRQGIVDLVAPYREKFPDWWQKLTDGLEEASAVVYAPHVPYPKSAEDASPGCCEFPADHPIHSSVLSGRANAIAREANLQEGVET